MLWCGCPGCYSQANIFSSCFRSLMDHDWRLPEKTTALGRVSKGISHLLKHQLGRVRIWLLWKTFFCSGTFFGVNWVVYWDSCFLTQFSTCLSSFDSFNDIDPQGFPINMMCTDLYSEVCILELNEVQSLRAFRRWAILQNGDMQHQMWKDSFNRSSFDVPSLLLKTAYG